LVDKDLLRATGADIYAFRHILIREVAYQTLTRAERGRLHAAAAHWLEGIAGEREDSLAELIAYHYREAAMIDTAQRPGEVETQRVRDKAVDWLSRAADVAAAGAANLEGGRHLRTAIELAQPTRLPDLYQRLGEMAESGELRIEAYRNALRLCREQGRAPTQQLQILAGMLTSYTRFQGSVANRLPVEAMAELRRDARAVAVQVTDERALGAYYAAEGFFPFWIQGSGAQVTEAEIAEADASAKRALDIGRRLDDPNLQSAALDALAGTGGVIHDDWRGSREYSRQRLAFQDRLDMFEKVDAHSMVVWSSALLGDLDEAERVSAQGLAQVQPGQVPAVVLHLVVWRIYVLTLLGRWDESLAMAQRARQLQVESSQSTAGYALRGFMAALDVARARQDEGLLELYGTIHDEIAAAFPEGSPFRWWRGYSRTDLESCQAAVEHFLLNPRLQIERLERGLSMLLDHDRVPSTDGLVSVLAVCREAEFPLLEAQVERALGRAKREVTRLDRAIMLFDRSGAPPYAARVRCERALMTGDAAQMEAGLAILERVGDAEQVLRFERLQVG
jgi:hypothetical protein